MPLEFHWQLSNWVEPLRLTLTTWTGSIIIPLLFFIDARRKVVFFSKTTTAKRVWIASIIINRRETYGFVSYFQFERLLNYLEIDIPPFIDLQVFTIFIVGPYYHCFKPFLQKWFATIEIVVWVVSILGCQLLIWQILPI